jgi:hypothetical protein
MDKEKTEVTETKEAPKTRGEDCEDGCSAQKHFFCVPLGFTFSG